MRSAAVAARSASDASFGPTLNGLFDFTLTFENWFLVVAPAATLIVATPFYVFRYLRQPVQCLAGWLLWAKLAVVLGIFCVEIALGVLWSLSDDFPASSAVAAVCFSCISVVCIGVISGLGHRRSIKSPGFLSLFLFITFLLEVVRSRSLLMRPKLDATGALAVVGVVARVALLLLEEVPKPLKEEAKGTGELNKEATGGFWNRTLLIWLNPVIWNGFSNSLSVGKLLSLGPEFSSKRLSERFEPIWEKTPKDSKLALLKACVRTMPLDFFVAAIPRLCYTGFSFSIPQLVERVVSYVGNHEAGHKQQGSGLIGASAVIYLGASLATTTHTHLMNIFMTKLRGLLVARVLIKNMNLDHAKAKESAALTLMSTDVEGILNPILDIHSIWVSFIEMGLALYLMWRRVGSSFFFPLIIQLITFVIVYFIGIAMGPAVKSWNGSIQTRVSKMSVVLAQMKSVKMTGAEEVVRDFIRKLRLEEVRRSLAVRRIKIMIIAIYPVDYILAPATLLAGAIWWTTFRNGLDPVTLFPTLALFALFEDPANIILNCWPQLGEIAACNERLQSFLLLEEREDRRKICDHHDEPGLPSKKAEVSTVERSIDDSNATESEKNSFGATALRLSNASIAPEHTSSGAALNNLNLSVERGTLTIVTGAVGCGKSTLLRGLLGEGPLREGSIEIERSSMAYSDQKIWLPNVTIQQAIVGKSPFDSEWYATIVKAFLLDVDIAQFPKQDQSRVGSNGSLLSGGQKARVAAARAFYAQMEIVVLDDIFSALDKKTAQKIFSNVLQRDSPIRKKLQATVILATHSVEYLGAADQVWLINKDGTVVSESPEIANRLAKDQNIDLHNAGNVLHSADESDVVASSEKAEPETEGDDDFAEEKAKISGGGDWTLYVYFLRSVAKWLILIWLVGIALVAFMEKSFDIYSRVWVDVAPKSKVFFVGLVVLGVAAMIINATAAWIYMIMISPKIAISLHDIFLDTVTSATLAFLTETSSGILLNRSSQDMTLLSQEMPMAFYRWVYITFLATADTVIVIAGSKYAAVIIPFLFIFMFALQLVYLRTSRQMRYLDLEAKTPLYSQLSETISGLEHIRSFGWQDQTLEEFFGLLDYSQKPYYYMFCIQRWLLLVLDFVGSAAAIILVSIAVFLTYSTNQPSIGLAMVGTMFLSLVLRNWVRNWTQLETALGAVKRLRTFEQETPVERDKAGAQDIPDWPSRGTIEFKNVTAKYSSSAQTPVLEDVSVTIEAGKKVGIIGRTGSGKSSFLLSLVRLLEYSGSISIDGVEISDVPRQQLRTSITTISQDSLDLPGSVRGNLLPKTRSSSTVETTDDYLKSILERVELWDHIVAKGGLEKPLDDMSFSQGQKQLFTIARSIVYQSMTGSKIVMVDEATSNIDHATDVRVQKVMKEAFHSCTVLTIAHRVQTIQDVDEILEFSGGSLARVQEIKVAKSQIFLKYKN